MSKQILVLILLGLLLTEVHSDDNASDVRAPAKCKKPNGKIGQTKVKGCSTNICKKSDGGGAAWAECPRPASDENVNQGMQSITSLLKEVLTNLGDTFDTSVNNELKVITDLLQGPLFRPIVTLLREILENMGNPFDVSINNELKVITDFLVGSVTKEFEKITELLHEVIRILGPPTTSMMPSTTASSGLRVVFEKIEEFAIEKDNLLGTLPFLGKQFRIVFDLFVSSFSRPSNILHFTIGGNGGHGDRTPAFFRTENERIYIASAINGTSSGIYIDETLPVGQWNKIEMSQILSDNAFIFSYRVNGVDYWNPENEQPKSFTDVLMYASDNFYDAPEDGKIRNFIVETMDD